MSEPAEETLALLTGHVVKRLSEAGNAAEGEEDSVEHHLAMAVSRVFTARAVRVLWRHESGPYGRVERGVHLRDEAHNPEPNALPPLEETLDTILDRLSQGGGYFDGRVTLSPEGQSSLVVIYGEVDRQGKDLLILQLGEPKEADEVRYTHLASMVQSYRTGWKQIFQLTKGHVRQDVRGRRVAAARSKAELEGEVRALTSEAQRPVEERREMEPRLARLVDEARALFERAVTLEQQATREGHSVIAGELRVILDVLTRWVLNLVYGTGREDREVEEVRAARQAVRAYAEAARETDGVGVSYLPLELSRMLQAAVGELEPTGIDEGAGRLSLLARWTQTHQWVQRAAEGRADAEAAEHAWALARAETAHALPRVLVEAWCADGERLRSWLRLWFVSRLVLHPSAGGLVRGAGGKRRLQGDLAYALRECLRLEDHTRWLESGPRGDALRPADLPWAFLQPQSTLRQALSALVEHHATVMVGLPRALDLGVIIDEIGRSDGAEGHIFSTGHLQHVLDVYMVGEFLMELRLRWEAAPREETAEDAPRTLAEALASRTGHAPGEHAVYQLRQTFALTALFHDVGMRLFPHYRLPGPPFIHGDRSVEATVTEIDQALRATGRSVARRCAEELDPYELLHPTRDAEMRSWIDRQVTEGAPDHALLGAWYLARMAREVPDTPKDILLPALRAVLLHGVTTQVIDSVLDPVAALLVLCDELFDWDPVARGGAESSPSPAGLPAAPHRSRVAHLQLQGFEASVVAGEFVASIPARLPPADEPLRETWPALALTLHRPQVLGQPTYEVWLSIAQNLRRIEPSFLGWGPVLRLSGEAPQRYQPAGGTWRLLQDAVSRSRVPVRGHLSAWLDAQQQDPPVGPREELVIRATGEALANRDLRPSFPELRRQAEAILRERRGRGGPKGGG
jgi:hypothetical protein